MDPRRHQRAPDGGRPAAAVGPGSTCALRIDGVFICWGYATSPPSTDNFVQLAVGDGFTCGVKSNKRLACSGSDGASGAFPAADAGLTGSASHHRQI